MWHLQRNPLRLASLFSVLETPCSFVLPPFDVILVTSNRGRFLQLGQCGGKVGGGGTSCRHTVTGSNVLFPPRVDLPRCFPVDVSIHVTFL